MTGGPPPWVIYGDPFHPLALPNSDSWPELGPTPHPKPPSISPIFTADNVTLVVSREKDGKLRLVYAGWDDVSVVQPDGCGQARRGMDALVFEVALRVTAPPPVMRNGPPEGGPLYLLVVGQQDLPHPQRGLALESR